MVQFTVTVQFTDKKQLTAKIYFIDNISFTVKLLFTVKKRFTVNIVFAEKICFTVKRLFTVKFVFIVKKQFTVKEVFTVKFFLLLMKSLRIKQKVLICTMLGKYKFGSINYRLHSIVYMYFFACHFVFLNDLDTSKNYVKNFFTVNLKLTFTNVKFQVQNVLKNVYDKTYLFHVKP